MTTYNIGDVIRTDIFQDKELNDRSQGTIVAIGGSPAKIERGEGWYELDNGTMVRRDSSDIILVRRAGE